MSAARTLVFLSLLLLLAAVGCGDDNSASPEPPITVDVYFNLSVDGAPLQITTSAQTFTTPGGTKYGIKTLRFIISDVKLHDDQGNAVTVKSVHYFDIGDPGTQTIHATGLPHANYESVSFTFGLDASKNIRDKYKNLIPAIMDWPTGLGPDLGYHYMQLEGNYEQTPGGSTGGYTTHTGPRHLDGTNQNFPGVVDATAYHFSFPVSASFSPTHIHEGGEGELEISFNLNGWYLDHTPSDGNDTSYDFTTLGNQMIMGNLEAQGKLQTNGPGCFGATLTATGGHDH